MSWKHSKNTNLGTSCSTDPLLGQEAKDRHEFWAGGQEKRRLQNVLRDISRMIDCGGCQKNWRLGNQFSGGG